jgi:tetratricopeptide (TPR) repeat protein
MKTRGIKVASISIILVLTVFSINLRSQTVNDAIAEFNSGAQIIASDPAVALAHFNKCVELCDVIGDEASDTRTKAAVQIPKLHFKLAMESYKAKKYTEAIKQFEMTVETGEKYNDAETAKKAKRAIPQLYWANGNQLNKEGNQSGALENYNKAIELNPKYAKAYLSKGLIYKDMDDVENMQVALDNAMAFAGKDQKTMDASEKVLQNTFFNKGIVAYQENRYDDTEMYMKKSIEYGNELVDAFYTLGKVYIQKGDFNNAVSYLTQAETKEMGGDEAKAKINFELGNAYAGLNDTAKACDSFKKAMFGEYAENAKYQVEEVLKCQ